jgi:Zn-dependent protease
VTAVLLYEPESTPMDLRFRLFGTYVRVHPFFWLISVMLGWSWSSLALLPGNGLGDVATWVLCVFLSILLHEFGHVWMGRLFGTNGHILLHGMGGLAIGSNDLSSRWKRILVSFAGPGIQLLFWGGMWLAGVDPSALLRKAMLGKMKGDATSSELFGWLLLIMLYDINLWWPLLNLLPIWPLDGGMITREVCTGVAPSRGLLVSLWISVLVAAVLAINALMGEQKRHFIPYAPVGTFMAIWFAFFAVGSFQAIQILNSQRRSYDDDLPWER